MIGCCRRLGIGFCAAALFSFLNTAFAAAVEFSPITQAQVENEGCEVSESGAPLIVTASNDPSAAQANGIVQTTIEFRPVDGNLTLQRYTRYSNTKGEGTYTGKVMDVPTEYAKAGKVIAKVKFKFPGTYQHIIVLESKECESRVTLPTIDVR